MADHVMARLDLTLLRRFGLAALRGIGAAGVELAALGRVGGRLLDPNSGLQYSARARLMNSGKHLIIHSRTEGSAVGRNLTWVKY